MPGLDDLIKLPFTIIGIVVGAFLVILALIEFQHELEIVKFLLGLGIVGAIIAVVFLDFLNKR